MDVAGGAGAGVGRLPDPAAMHVLHHLVRQAPRGYGAGLRQGRLRGDRPRPTRRTARGDDHRGQPEHDD